MARVRLHDHIMSHFDTIPMCDGQTDGWTDQQTYYTAVIQHSAQQAMLMHCNNTYDDITDMCMASMNIPLHIYQYLD